MPRPEASTTSRSRASPTAPRWSLGLGLMMVVLALSCQPSHASPTSWRSAPYEARTLTAAAGGWMAHLAAPSAAAARARRTRCQRSSPCTGLRLASFQLAYLEGRSIADPTQKDYFKKVLAFLEWAVESKVEWDSHSGLDLALALYMD